MPTPFMHLQIAERILSDASLSDRTRRTLQAHYPAFYLGSVAPDYQTICNVPRETTHFYNLPPDDGDRAYPKLLSSFPELAQQIRRSREQAVFIAAYCAHLMLDLRWYHEILTPYFVEPLEWESHHQRFVVHNTLLTYLDKQAVKALPDSAAGILTVAKPKGWLPFARDEELIEWRDLLVAQLRPGALLRTVEIYAKRLFLTPEEFASNLEEPAWMEAYLFSRVPIPDVQNILTSAVTESVGIMTALLDESGLK
jgi:hypothetical protein